jgi:hypothetical protein
MGTEPLLVQWISAFFHVGNIKNLWFFSLWGNRVRILMIVRGIA